jgi:predicted DsbA family dithiol-disulfide isomerase
MTPPTADPSRILVVFGDFVCPWSYAVLDSVERLAAEFDLEPWWRPHLLHPDTPLEGAPFPADAQRQERLGATKVWLEEVAPERAAKMTYPDRLQCSWPAFIGLELAEEQGCAWPYAQAVFDALWVQGKNIAEPTVLREAGEAAGIDPSDMNHVLQDNGYAQRMLASAEQAQRLGVTATPTLILGKTRVNGWHYHEVLRDLIFQQVGVAAPPSPAAGERSPNPS